MKSEISSGRQLKTEANQYCWILHKETLQWLLQRQLVVMRMQLPWLLSSCLVLHTSDTKAATLSTLCLYTLAVALHVPRGGGFYSLYDSVRETQPHALYCCACWRSCWWWWDKAVGTNCGGSFGFIAAPPVISGQNDIYALRPGRQTSDKRLPLKDLPINSGDFREQYAT